MPTRLAREDGSRKVVIEVGEDSAGDMGGFVFVMPISRVLELATAIDNGPIGVAQM